MNAGTSTRRQIMSARFDSLMQEAQQALATYQKLIESNRQKKRESLEADKP